MANNERKSRSADQRQPSRCAYFPPILKEFGPVGILTQAGTGTMIEPNMNAMATKKRP